jgi:hypothetical protein
MKDVIKKAIKRQSRHFVVINAAHSVGGFGLAIVLQQYMVGNPFLPAWIGWALIVLAVAGHVYAFASKN